jgi:hypothetical protein
VGIEWFDESMRPTPIQGSLRIAPDFLPWRTNPSRIHAKLNRGSDVWYTSGVIPVFQSSWPAWGRLVGMISMVAMALFLATLKYRRNRTRNKRLKGKEVPYIAGEIIMDPELFFGRVNDLNEIRDSIGGASYLIVADFRTGKTSLQHQLTLILQEVDHPSFVYYPIFIDMQRFSGRTEDLFHFLGRHLLLLAEQNEVPAEEIRDLEISTLDAAKYGLDEFENDLDTLIDYWKPQTGRRAPRIVLQIDEIGFLEPLNYGVMPQLRSVFIQRPELKTIMSGVEIPHEKVQDVVSQWWNFMRLKILEPLKPDEARSLIVEPARGLFTFDKEAVVDIMIEAKYRPFIIQKLCTDLLNYKYTQVPLNTGITLEDFRTSLRNRKKEER